MYTYVRSTKLSDIGGRSDYITNATGRHKEEDVLCVGGATSDWKPYHAYEQAHRRSSEPNNEGRELIVALPNSWGNLINRPLLKSRVDSLAKKLLGKSTDYQFAVHWNGSHTNLHAHIIFSEREIRPQTKSNAPTSDFYDRDIYLTRDGKIARKKADRALNEDGTEKPPIHRKGEPKNIDFSPKDKRYKSRAWLQHVKEIVERTFLLAPDKKHPINYLHTFHEGKAPRAAENTKLHNRCIRVINQKLDDLSKEGYQLKKKGDKVYNALYNKVVEELKRDTGDYHAVVDDWIMTNVVLNADKVQDKAKKQEERAERAADRREKREERAADRREASERQRTEKILETAYNTAIEVFNGRLSRDISRNNLTYDALRELTGSEYGTYSSKKQPKLEKELQKVVLQVAEMGKTSELVRKLETYFNDKLDYNKGNRGFAHYATFEEPFTASEKLMTDINGYSSEPNVSFTLPISQKKQQEQRERERQRQRTQQRERYVSTNEQQKQQPKSKEPVYYQPSAEPQHNATVRKRDTGAR